MFVNNVYRFISVFYSDTIVVVQVKQAELLVHLQLVMRLSRRRNQKLQPQKRGPKNKAAKLQGWQAAQICNIIRDRHPEQMKLPFALWNARAVRDLIKRKHTTVFAVRYVQVLLKLWGYTPQKPALL